MAGQTCGVDLVSYMEHLRQRDAVYSGDTMQTFAITFLISTAASICLWQFGLGKMMWPAQPFLASLLTALACGVAIQLLLSRNAAVQESRK